MIELENISIELGDFALKNCSLTIHDNDYYIIMGPSGAGKTILLELIAGILTPDNGKISVDGKDIAKIPPEKRNIGIVYQDYALFPHMTVRENICFGMKLKKIPKDEQQKRLNNLTDQFGISHLLERNAATLSGGEAQRTALARALAVEPKILLIDEPFSALDENTRKRCIADMKRLHETGITIVQITHSREEADILATHLAVIINGTVAAEGTRDEVFSHPKDKITAEFVGFDNFFEREGKQYAIRSEDIILEKSGTGIQGTIISKVCRGAVIEYIVDAGYTIKAVMGKREGDFSEGDSVFIRTADNAEIFLQR